MKSNISFLVISVFALFGAIHSYACGPWEYYPYGYKMYRVFDKGTIVEPDERMENCLLWQKLTSDDIPLEDIERVVYKYTLAQMKEMMSVCDSNAFAGWIRENKDTEIYDFLILAKKCEYSRGMMNDPWYYPSKNDGTYMSLVDIAETAKGYNGTRLKDRYALQAVRAMFSAKLYDECINYWTRIEDSLPDGLIKEMARSYLVGVYSKTGQIDYALEYFTKAGDLNSIIYCLSQQGKIKDEIDELECIAKYAPDSKQIPEILQRIISSYEPSGYRNYSYEYRRDISMFGDERLYKLVVEMTNTKMSSNTAVWYYTAAFLADLSAKSNDAWKYILQAEICPTTSYVKESIRVLKMYIDAKVSKYDSAYESRLFNDLKWLEAKVRNNITDTVKEDVEFYYQYRSYDYNISFYYWNDVLRRILLAEICPRMLDRGMAVRALQLANMADNLLLNIVDSIDGKSLYEYRKMISYNSIDYRGDFFKMMFSSVDVNDLITYVKHVNNSKTLMDKLLNSSGFIDYDYFNDVIGTRYLNQMNYRKAVQYLSKVSSSYQSRLNTSKYMYRDPFSLGGSRQVSQEAYKQSFAREMVRLEDAIESSKDNNTKAFDMIKYGIGIRNSFTDCWVLTGYSRASWPSDISDSVQPVFRKVESIFNEALAIINNEELAAAAHVKLCQWETACHKYPDSFAAKYTKVVCDNLCDYSLSHVVTHTIYGIWE